jgi:glutathione peroxidase
MINNNYMRFLKYKLLMFLVPFSCANSNKGIETTAGVTPGNTVVTGFHALSAKTLDGQIISFEKYKGKKVLIVNTASECGFTPQFEELQLLHEQYGSKVEVLGFPCNQFGEQDPGSNEEIGAFCKKNYGVTFQMFEKVDVKGDNVHPVYKWLTDKSLNGVNDKAPGWNFGKYLISEKGEFIDFYPSSVSPMNKNIVDKL